MDNSLINWTNIYGTYSVFGIVELPGLHSKQYGLVLLEEVSRVAGLGGKVACVAIMSLGGGLRAAVVSRREPMET